MKTILFVGDSITDSGRCLTDDHFLGYGYATMTAGMIGCDYPNQYRMVNRGINGNRSIDLYARIKKDIINLKPDYLSILIGVNDVWHELDYQDGVSAEKYEMILDTMIHEIKTALPDIQIVIMEPFLLRGSGTAKYFDEFSVEVKKRADSAKKIAEKIHLPFVPLQSVMENFASKTSSEYILIDGVHPTYVGHELIARELYGVYKRILHSHEYEILTK